MAGGSQLTLTGQLGDVMKESARIALSWFRAHATRFGVDPQFYRDAELHMHVPAGAIPKDGPSAGVTMVTALASALSGRPVRSDVAMTGEITLSGRVLPVGGIKEKVLAAKRAGITTVILPRQNEKNIREDLTDELRSGLTVHYVDEMDEVLKLALCRRAASARPRATARRSCAAAASAARGLSATGARHWASEHFGQTLSKGSRAPEVISPERGFVPSWLRDLVVNDLSISACVRPFAISAARSNFTAIGARCPRRRALSASM